jgi:hypothetical protein
MNLLSTCAMLARARTRRLLVALPAAASLLGGAGCQRGPRADGAARRDTGTAQPTASAPAAEAAEGAVHVVFTARDPHAYCREDDCSGNSPVSIRAASGRAPLLLSPGRCAIACADCHPVPCPSPACTPSALPLAAAELTWDGTYYDPGFCNGSIPCVTRRTAPPGKYLAELCAHRGSRTNDSIGAPICIASGGESCVAVEFDYPARGPVSGSF